MPRPSVASSASAPGARLPEQRLFLRAQERAGQALPDLSAVGHDFSFDAATQVSHGATTLRLHFQADALLPQWLVLETRRRCRRNGSQAVRELGVSRGQRYRRLGAARARQGG